MLNKKSFQIIALFVIALVLVACGQLSVGVVTPGSPGSQIEPTVVLSPEVVTPEPVVSAEPESEPEAQPEEAAHAIPTMVYIGIDNNLWILDAGSDSPRQLSTDGNPFGNENPVVEFSFPRISSDGNFLAYRKDVSNPVDGGYEFTSGLWVMDLLTGAETQLIDGLIAGIAWKPESHTLAFGTGVETEYFISRGEPDPALANGISAYDADTGSITELVAPERGFTLAGPQWSLDGRFLAFSEVVAMEGSGMFAYYDFLVEQYTAWDEAVGFASWSPNGGLLTYSRQTYVATGEERLYLRQREGAEELLGPDYDGPAYATLPTFSPDGAQIAYLAFLEGPDVNVATITVLDLASGGTTTFGQFEGPWELSWTPDGSHLVFNAGAWESRQLVALNIVDGSQIVLAEGSQASLAGR